MYIDIRNALQEGVSLYRITLLHPLSFMDFLIGLGLLLLYPVVVLLCLASNCHQDTIPGLHFHQSKEKSHGTG
ncbi:MAG: hypothetical protein AABZ60_08515 [Planctomycetota bacterium]